MTTRKQFEKVIINKSDIPNKNGYVLNTLDNLVDGVGFDLFQTDLMQYEVKYGKIKLLGMVA